MESLVRGANQSDWDMAGELGDFPEKVGHQFTCSWLYDTRRLKKKLSEVLKIKSKREK